MYETIQIFHTKFAFQIFHIWGAGTGIEAKALHMPPSLFVYILFEDIAWTGLQFMILLLLPLK
jgi:hypothetical protein